MGQKERKIGPNKLFPTKIDFFKSKIEQVYPILLQVKLLKLNLRYDFIKKQVYSRVNTQLTHKNLNSY